VFYLDVQLDVLLSMARVLSQGLELPEALLAHYGQSEILPSLEKRAETDPAVDAPIEFGVQSFLKWFITQWHAYRHRLQRRVRQIQHTWQAVWKPFRRKR